MMQDKTIRTSATLSIGMLCGLMAACAGADTPPRDSDLEDQIRAAYASGSRPTGSAGSATAPAGGGSAGARATTGAGGAPPASRGGSGGGAAVAAAGAGMDDPEPATGGSGGGGDCDGFALLASCNGGSCHGAGSGLGNFAESEAAAKTFVGKSGTVTCSANGPLFNPDDPASSVVVRKVSANPPCGGLMPAGSTMPVFSADQIQCLEDWISTL
jgi:hypothetical protein